METRPFSSMLMMLSSISEIIHSSSSCLFSNYSFPTTFSALFQLVFCMSRKCAAKVLHAASAGCFELSCCTFCAFCDSMSCCSAIWHQPYVESITDCLLGIIKKWITSKLLLIKSPENVFQLWKFNGVCKVSPQSLSLLHLFWMSWIFFYLYSHRCFPLHYFSLFLKYI